MGSGYWLTGSSKTLLSYENPINCLKVVLGYSIMVQLSFWYAHKIRDNQSEVDRALSKMMKFGVKNSANGQAVRRNLCSLQCNYFWDTLLFLLSQFSEIVLFQKCSMSKSISLSTTYLITWANVFLWNWSDMFVKLVLHLAPVVTVFTWYVWSKIAITL